MGKLINLKCEKCGYETNLGVGAGMNYYDLEKVITMFDTDTREKIRAEVATGKIWYVRKEIGVCDNCGKISAIAVFRSEDNTGKVTEYKTKCACGSTSLELYDADDVIEGKVTISCPICSDTLTVSFNGMWD